jgi:hypothetical protein
VTPHPSDADYGLKRCKDCGETFVPHGTRKLCPECHEARFPEHGEPLDCVAMMERGARQHALGIERDA